MALITFHKTIEKLTNPIKTKIKSAIVGLPERLENIYKIANKHAYSMEYIKKRTKNSIL